MDGLAAATAALDVTETGQITHAPATTATAWREALASASTVPTHALSKSLLLKPKLAKTAEQVYILVVALEETDTPANPIAKHLSFKEARSAADDAIKAVLGVDKDALSPFLVNEKNKAAIVVALDKKLAESSDLVAFHATAEKTFFVPGSEVKSYLTKTGVSVSEFNGADFAKPADAATPIATAPKATSAAKAKKADAKIEGAALIGIDVRKDGDFSEWYQQVLTKGDMLDYYDISGCYILKPWSYHVWEVIQGELSMIYKCVPNISLVRCSYQRAWS